MKINVKQLLIFSFLLPAIILIVVGIFNISHVIDQLEQSNNQKKVDNLINESHGLAAIVHRLMVHNLSKIRSDVDLVDDNSKTTSAQLIADVKSEIKLLKSHIPENKVWQAGPLFKQLEGLIEDLKEQDKRIQQGLAVDHDNWTESGLESLNVLYQLWLVILSDVEQHNLILYLQINLRSKVYELEYFTLDEIIALDQAIYMGEISEHLSARMTFSRNQAKRMRDEMYIILEQLASANGISQDYFKSLKYELERTKKAFELFDNIRRRVYSSALMGGAPMPSLEWNQATHEILLQLQKTHEAVSGPILKIIDKNQNNNIQILYLTAVIWGGILLILLAILYVLYKRILNPIKQVTESMLALSRGRLDVDLPVHHANDEIGNMLEAITVFKDNALVIQKQKEDLLEAQQQAIASERMKAEFLATMSHEIRTPMNGVLGMLTLMLKTSVTKEQARYLALAKSSAESLLHIINDILDFSKIEAGKLDLEEVEFNIPVLFEEMARALAIQAEKNKVDLILNVLAVNGMWAFGDPNRLRQVLTNIVSNAIKFSAEGQVTIHVEKVSQIGGQVRFTTVVTDTGIGIPPDKMNTLFSRFTQVDASTTRKYGGTGLGLAITKHLVDIMGGSLSVQSEVGVGSAFSIELGFPLVKVEIDKLFDLRERNVLIVDAQDQSGTALQDILMCWGAEVQVLTNPLKALVCLTQDQQYDAILVDSNIQQIKVWEFVKIVRNNEKFKDIELVVVLPVTDVSELDSGVFNEEWPTIHKPYSLGELAYLFNLLWGQASRMTHGRRAVPESLPGFPGLSVLLVEDNPVNQEVAKGIFEDFEIDITVANNGHEALEILSKGASVDIIFMDCQMPIMDGYECTRMLRTSPKFKRFCDIPIVAMTANAMKGDREKCLAAGMSDYVSKPIDEDRILEVLTTWSDKHCLVEPVDSVVHPNAVTVEPALPVWDQDQALKRVRGKTERLQKLIELYFDGLELTLARLASAVEEKNLVDVKSIIHSIKGSVAQLGGDRLADVIKSYEVKIAEGAEVPIDLLLEDVARESESFGAALRAYQP